MTVGDEVFGFLKTLPTDVLVGIVHAVYPDAKVMRVEVSKQFAGKREEWYIVSHCQCTGYSAVSLVGERGAWLSAVQRICTKKWPMAAKEFIQEGV